MRKLYAIITGIFLALLFTSCKQFTADIDDFLSYWTAEVIPVDFSFDKPSQTSAAGAVCLPSASDVTVTVNLRNPKNFSLVTPVSTADAGKVINFPGLSTQPAYGTDYTLAQTADKSALKLIYKSSFLKKHEWSTDNVGAEITLISTDGRKFNKKFNLNVKVDTPPKLSYVTIGKTRNADAHGKFYYVIILKAEDMDKKAGASNPPTELLHKDIKTLSVEGGDSAGIAFTSGNTAFNANGRLLAATEVAQLTPADLGSATAPDWDPAKVAGPWTLRYKTDTEVRTASKTYTFRLVDGKGFSSSVVSQATLETEAQDATLSYGTTPITGPTPANPHEINAGENDTEVTVTAKTATVGAKITGTVEWQDGSELKHNNINSGSQNEVDIRLPAPELNQEILYKITVTAGGAGFASGTEKVFYVKITKRVEITVNGGTGSAWDALKAAVENNTAASIIIIDGEIKAPNGAQKIEVKRPVTIRGKTGKTADKLNADNKTFIFHVWSSGDLTLKKLTLQNGNNPTTGGIDGGGAIYCAGGKLTADDVIIENCKAKYGGGIYLNGSSGMTLTNCHIRNNEVTNGDGGGINFKYGTYSGSYTITGGNISDNKVKMTGSVNQYSGGGLAIENVSINLTLDDCEISSNTIQGPSGKIPRGAGMWLGNRANCTIKGSAKIINNKAHVTGTPNSFIGTGGGIQLDGGTLTLEDGTVISGNSAQDGGGVYVQDGEFAMKGGKIENNTAQNGGGVYIDAQASRVGTFKMEGSATVTPSTEGDANVPGKNDVYLADFSNGNGGYDYAVIIVTAQLNNTPVARLTMRNDYQFPETSGYHWRVVVEGIKSDDDALKFKVTPQITQLSPSLTLKNWRVVWDHTNSGQLQPAP